MLSTQRFSNIYKFSSELSGVGQDGTDYWLGGLDADRDHHMQWMSGAEMKFSDFVKDQPNGLPYLHMNFDNGFK